MPGKPVSELNQKVWSRDYITGSGSNTAILTLFSVVFCCRYDIKGCEVSRWTDPAPEGSQVIVVLKDLNFKGQYITLGKRN